MSSERSAVSGDSELRTNLVERLNEAMRQQSTQTVMLHTVIASRLGLNATDHKTLDIVLRHGSLTAGQIADFTGLTTGAVTGVIDRLEKAGLAQRSKDESDRRRVVIEVAPEAVEKLAPMFVALSQSMEALAADYNNVELELICTFIERCSRIAQEESIRLRHE